MTRKLDLRLKGKEEELLRDKVRKATFFASGRHQGSKSSPRPPSNFFGSVRFACTLRLHRFEFLPESPLKMECGSLVLMGWPLVPHPSLGTRKLATSGLCGRRDTRIGSVSSTRTRFYMLQILHRANNLCIVLCVHVRTRIHKPVFMNSCSECSEMFPSTQAASDVPAFFFKLHACVPLPCVPWVCLDYISTHVLFAAFCRENSMV